MKDHSVFKMEKSPEILFYSIEQLAYLNVDFTPTTATIVVALVRANAFHGCSSISLFLK
jgi:hypothetical protein